jgi:hypothetical protein
MGAGDITVDRDVADAKVADRPLLRLDVGDPARSSRVDSRDLFDRAEDLDEPNALPVAEATCGSVFSAWGRLSSIPPLTPVPESTTMSPANVRSTLALMDARRRTRRW